MFVCLVAVCVACLWTGFINVRMRQEIRSLCLQLAELEQGSHMELTVLSRQKTLLTLCRAMNRVLAFRDRTHVQYEASQKQMQRNITSLAHDIRTPLTGAVCRYRPFWGTAFWGCMGHFRKKGYRPRWILRWKASPYREMRRPFGGCF